MWAVVKCANCVTQVRANMRTAITVPEQNWAAFRDVLNQFIESTPTASATPGGAVEAASSASAADGTKE